MLGFVTAAALAGLAGSPHCVGMCGAFALASGAHAKQTLPWHAGRLVTYGMLGAIAGFTGSVIPGPGWVGAVLSTLLICWFAAALAGLVPEPRIVLPGFKKLASSLVGRRGATARFAFGLANGLLPCGLVYAALSIPVAAADPITGALAMLAFGLGTVPALTALVWGAGRFSLKSLRARRVMAVAVLIISLLAVGMREGLIGELGSSGAGHVHQP